MEQQQYCRPQFNKEKSVCIHQAMHRYQIRVTLPEFFAQTLTKPVDYSQVALWLKVLGNICNLGEQPLFSSLFKELSVKEHKSIILFANAMI